MKAPPGPEFSDLGKLNVGTAKSKMYQPQRRVKFTKKLEYLLRVFAPVLPQISLSSFVKLVKIILNFLKNIHSLPWALGGTKDDITPPLQATGHLGMVDMTPPLQAVGHMDLIDSVPDGDKLKLMWGGGHMGLFRSVKILDEYYRKIVGFILERSDRKEM